MLGVLFFAPFLGAVQQSQYGVRVKSSQNTIFKGLNLIRGDHVYFFNNKSLSSHKKFLRDLLELKDKKFSLIVKRKSKYYRLNYSRQGKRKYKLLKTKRIYSKELERIVSKNHKPTTQKNLKQQVSLKKYKKFLQNAYIIAERSFVYKKPNFDSEQIFYFKPGAKVKISKKIFYPEHKFGSFFKVFIKSPQKIVGYISEVEVVPEYLTDKKTKKNPRYTILEKQLKTSKNYKVDFQKLSPHREEKINHKTRVPFVISSHFKGLGVLLGWRSLVRFEGWRSAQNVFAGLKWTNPKILSPFYLDVNAYFNPLILPFSSYYGEGLIGFPILNHPFVSVSVLGGLKVEFAKSEQQTKVSQGLIFGLSFLKPFSSVFVRGDIRGEMGLQDQQFQLGLFTSFQVPF